MYQLKLFLLTLSFISLTTSTNNSYGFGEEGQGIRDLINYRAHMLSAKEISELNPKSEGDITNPYDQCISLWGGKEKFHQGQKARDFDGGSIAGQWGRKGGPWDKLEEMADYDFRQPPDKNILKQLAQAIKADMQANMMNGFVDPNSDDAKKDLVLGYLAYIYSKYFLKGISLLDHMGSCSAIYIMTSKHTDATKGDAYEPKSMGMMMMMSMGGMGGMGTNPAMMYGGMSGMGNVGTSMMGGMNGMTGMNPMMMMMMGGSVKCQAMGPQTQDFHDCKKIVQMFDAAMIAQQGTQMAEQVQMGQSQINAQKKMLDNNANDGTVQLEVMKDQVSQQGQIAFTRAAFETIKTAGFGALWQNMPTVDSVKKLCLKNFPNNLGNERYLNFTATIKKQFEHYIQIHLKNQSYLRAARDVIDQDINKEFSDVDQNIRDVKSASRDLARKVKLCGNPNVTNTMEPFVNENNSKITEIENKLKEIKYGQSAGNSDISTEDLNNQLDMIQSEISKASGELDRDKRCNQYDDEKDDEKKKSSTSAPQPAIPLQPNQNVFNIFQNIFAIKSAYAQEENIPKPQGNIDAIVFKQLKTVYQDALQTVKGGGDEYCPEAYQEDFLPNQATRDFAKMMAVQAGSMAASNALKGGLANKQANEIQSIIDGMKKKKDVSDDGQTFGDEEMDTECKKNPELEKCKRYAGARQELGFQGLTDKTLSGGAPGGVINTGGTSSAFDNRKAMKGSADASKVGGAPGAFVAGGGGNRGSGFESGGVAPTNIKTKPNSGSGGGGVGMGGASAQSGGGMGDPSSGNAREGNVLANSGIDYKKSPNQAGRYNNAGNTNGRRKEDKANPFADLFNKNAQKSGSKLNLPKEVYPATNPLFERVDDAYMRAYQNKRIIQYEIFN